MPSCGREGAGGKTESEFDTGRAPIAEHDRNLPLNRVGPVSGFGLGSGGF